MGLGEAEVEEEEKEGRASDGGAFPDFDLDEYSPPCTYRMYMILCPALQALVEAV